MSIRFLRPQISTVPPSVGYESAPSISAIPPSPNSNYYSHQPSHSGSLTPSPTPSQTYIQPSDLAPGEQGHYGHASDHHSDHHGDYHQQHHDHHYRSHSHSRSHSGHGSPSATPAPPLMTPQNSEPAGYASGPPFQPQYAHPQYAPQPGYGPTLTPADGPPSPGPVGLPHGVSSPQYDQYSPADDQYPPADDQYPSADDQYPPATSAPYEPPVQTRALHPVARNSRSHGRQPPVSAGMDASAPKRHDWRCHPHFKRSRCTGGRKALCIGINYTGQSNPLQGCVDDAKSIYKFLNENHRYPHSNIIVLTDDNSNPRSQPTQKNILSAMRWLVDGAKADDALFFHYSGHGGRTRDLDGDEIDGWDEVIFPLDYKTSGIITDDVLHNTLVKPLPAGCRLTAVFDSCHSGSILDLNYEFHSNGRVKSSPVAAAFQKAKSSPADVVCFSGCKDSETSADTVQDGVAVGAMSYAYLKVLKRNPQISYIDLLRGVREILKKKYSQKPQLSATHELDIKRSFIM